MLVAALVDLNRFIHMCTRFTDEVFAGLISAIFIVNALGSPTSSVGVFHYFDDLHPSHEPYRNVTTPPRVNGSTDSGSDGELSGESGSASPALIEPRAARTRALATSAAAFRFASAVRWGARRERLLPQVLDDIAAALELGSARRAAPLAPQASDEVATAVAGAATAEEDQCDRLALGAVGGWGAAAATAVSESFDRCRVVMSMGTT